MKLPRFALALILFAVCQLSQAWPVAAETLEASIAHSEFLPAVPTLQSRVAVPAHYQKDALKAAAQQNNGGTLKSGTAESVPLQTAPLLPAMAQIDTAPAPEPTPPMPAKTPPTLEQPAIEWFPIPASMAGVWSKRGDLTTSVTDLRTGVTQPLNEWTDNELTVTWGHQTDKVGNVWHANVLPNERDSTSSGKFVKFFVIDQKLVAYTPPALVTRTHMIVSEQYGPAGPPADVFQQEALNHMQVLGGLLQVNNTTRVFTYHGEPMRDGALLSKYSRVAEYRPTGNLSGIDLASSLRQYLHSIGRTDLAP